MSTATEQELSETMDSVDKLVYPLPKLKHLEPRGSVSSVDSDLSLSFDRRSSVQSVESAPSFSEATDVTDADGSSENESNHDENEESKTKSEALETPFAPADDELAERIVQQVEFYFSDANITKDAFLLKHVKRNKEGYVSLKLISSFKRVKHLSKDWRVVADALKKSTKLEINDLGTKIRRLDPLPLYDETTPSRTIVVVDIPPNLVAIECIAEIFKKHGEISLIRILRPNNPIPADVRTLLNKNPALKNTTCALVEYVDSASSRKAVNEDSEVLKAYELNGVQKKLKSVLKKQESFCEHDDRFTRSYGARNWHHDCQQWLQRRMSSCSLSSDASGRRYSSGQDFCYQPRRFSGCSYSSCDGSRRCSLASDGAGSGFRSRANSDVFMNEHVVRKPMGPDGSRGFGNRNRRPSAPYLPVII